jgi:N-acetyl-anhydromuramyl-L-alanine amidase AmpD
VNGGDPRLPGAIRKAEGTNGGATSSPAKMGVDGVKAFIMHHTGGRGTVAGVQNTLRQRGLGVEYVMDRDGNIVQTGGRGAANIMPGWGPKGKGLNNSNIIGMEVIAKNDRDVTAAQIKAAKAFIDKNYPDLPVFGHGEVNPGHKEPDEGLSITNAIREGRERQFTNEHGLVKHGTRISSTIVVLP